MAKRAKARQKKKSAARRPPARVKPIPAGYHTVTAYLTVRDAARALEFYKSALRRRGNGAACPAPTARASCTPR